jgi:hypothetical protein
MQWGGVSAGDGYLFFRMIYLKSASVNRPYSGSDGFIGHHSPASLYGRWN